jgi:hypothetical protein
MLKRVWWAEAVRLAEELRVASEHISLEKTLHCHVVGTRAYAVLSATLKIWTEERGIDHQARNNHIHPHKAGRRVEGTVTDLGWLN